MSTSYHDIGSNCKKRNTVKKETQEYKVLKKIAKLGSCAVSMSLPIVHPSSAQMYSPTHASISLEHLHLLAWQTGAVSKLRTQDCSDPQWHDFVVELYVSA